MGAVYAVARNGLWEDPVEAASGAMFKAFKREVEKEGLGHTLVSYFTWRYSYLQCSAFFSFVWALLSHQDIVPDTSLLDDVMERLPDGINRSRFDNFITTVSMWNPILFYLWVLSLLFLLAAVLLASPSRCVKHARSSRQLVWISWLVNFIVPFTVLTLFPLRSLIDWISVEEDVCVLSVSRTLESRGVNIGAEISGLQQQGLLSSDVLGLPINMNGEPVAESEVRDWCREHRSDWDQIFFEDSVPCVWAVSDVCRHAVCMFARQEDQTSCMRQCVPYAQQTSSESGSEASTQFLSSLVQCNASAGASANTLEMPGLGSSNSQMQVFDMIRRVQQQMTHLQSQGAKSKIGYAEYLAGGAISFPTGSLLLGAALSVLGGLAEATVNLKAIFPGSQQASWILILTTFEAIPVYGALMGIMQQLIGDHVFAFTAVGVSAYVSLSAVTGVTSLRIRAGYDERWKFYRKLWVEYGLRVLFGLGVFVTLVSFVRNSFGSLASFDRLRISKLFFNFLARKSLMGVAGTDVLFSAFVQSELWRSSWTSEDIRTFKVSLVELGSILLPSHVQDNVGSQTGEPGQGTSDFIQVESLELDSTNHIAVLPNCSPDQAVRERKAPAKLLSEGEPLHVEDTVPEPASEPLHVEDTVPEPASEGRLTRVEALDVEHTTI